MKTAVLFFSTLLGISAFAQHENDKWYFGNYAGLDFSSGSPVQLTNGQTNVYEGTAVASDKTNGNLLFYSDGMNVWNSNHQLMPNGTGLNGHTSSTESALIVPKEGSSTIYYIFTTGSAAGYNGGYAGLCVSTVDMSLNSGLGDVTVKNQVLLTQSTEKLAAVRNTGCNGYWLVAHGWNSDAFYAYPVTSTGIGTPVISNTGSVHHDTGSGNNSEAIGYMRISNNGTRLALNTFINMNTVELFDFNAANGVVSNGAVIDTYPVSYNTGPYGLCFSPNDSRLYVSNNSIANSNALYQYDLTLSSAAAIGASRVMIDYSSVGGVRYSALQLAPNGKIYMVKYTSNTIDVINTPNGLGAACGFSANAITITSGTPSYGLPNFTVLPTCGKSGIENNTAQIAAIDLFPNPSEGKITLSIPGFYPGGNTQLFIYDTRGKLVYSEKINAVNSEINVSFLDAGLYLAEVTDNGKTLASRKLQLLK